MANNEIKTRIKQRYDTLANWESKNPILLEGEVARVKFPDGTVRTKTGNGTAIKFNDLAWDDKNLYNLNTSNAIGVSKDYVDEQDAKKLDKLTSDDPTMTFLYGTESSDGSPKLVPVITKRNQTMAGETAIPKYNDDFEIITNTSGENTNVAANVEYVNNKINSLTTDNLKNGSDTLILNDNWSF